jgi:hypothetical protein
MLSGWRGSRPPKLRRDGRIVLSYHIDVEDENGAALATVSFREAVKIEDRRGVTDEMPKQRAQSRASPNAMDEEKRRGVVRRE